MSDRRELTLGRVNLLIWEVYHTVANQFCHDFHISPLDVLAAYGVPDRLRPRLLRGLALVYEAHRKNQERARKVQ